MYYTPKKGHNDTFWVSTHCVLISLIASFVSFSHYSKAEAYIPAIHHSILKNKSNELTYVPPQSSSEPCDTLNPLTVISIANNNNINTICVGKSAGLIVNIEGGNSPYTLSLFDGNSDITIENYNTGDAIPVRPTQATSYTITSITDANNCTTPVSIPSVTVFVNAIPIPPIGFDVFACQDAQLPALSAIGFDLLWYESEVGGIGLGFPPIPNTSVAGEQEHWVSQTIDGCESERSLIVVTVHPRPAPPIVNDTSYFVGDIAAPLSANGTQIRWFENEIGGVSLPTPTPNTSNSGVEVFWVSQTVNGCESKRARVRTPIIEISDIMIGTITNPTNGSNGSIQITGLAPNARYVLSYEIGDQSIMFSIVTDSFGNYLLDNLSEGKYKNITILLGDNISILSAAIVLRNSCPLDYFIPVGSEICLGASIDLELSVSNGISPYIVKFDNGTDTLIISNFTNGRIIVSPSETTTYKLLSIEDAEGCILSLDENDGRVTIGIKGIPDPPTPATIQHCQNEIVMPLSVEGSNLLWYSSKVGGIGSETAPTPNTTNLGAQVFWVSQTVNRCESARSPISVIITPRPPLPVISNITYCLGEPTESLKAIGENIRWYIASEGGIGSTIAPVPTSNLPGRYHFWVSQSINGCESDRAKLTIYIKDNISPPITTDIHYCGTQNLVPLSAQGKNLLWYTSATGGIGSAYAPSPSKTLGTQRFWVSSKIGNCESSRSIINVFIYPQPSPPVIANPNPIYCEGDNINNSEVIGTNLKWYQQTKDGVSRNPISSPIASLGVQRYWITQTVNGCESEGVPITIIARERPQPIIGKTIAPTPCEQNGSIQLTNLTPNYNYFLSYEFNGMPRNTAINVGSDGVYILGSLEAGVYKNIQLTYNGCTSRSLSYELPGIPPTSEAALFGNTSICKGASTTIALTITGETGPYTIQLSNGKTTYNFENYNSGEGITVLPLTTTTYTLQSIRDVNNCLGLINPKQESIIVNVNDCSTDIVNQSQVTPLIPVTVHQTSHRAVANNNPLNAALAEQTIPTMSEWGLIIFGLLILNLSVIFIYRSKRMLKDSIS